MKARLAPVTQPRAPVARPNGAKHQSPGQARHERRPGSQAIRGEALKGRDNHRVSNRHPSVPHIRLVVFHLIQLGQSAELVLKSLCPVVFRLVRDVARHIIRVRRAHGKCAVSRLPREVADRALVLHPLRRFDLRVFQHVRNGHRAREPEENVDRVGDSADLSDAKQRRTVSSSARLPSTFRYVSCCPAKLASGKSSAVALLRAATSGGSQSPQRRSSYARTIADSRPSGRFAARMACRTWLARDRRLSMSRVSRSARIRRISRSTPDSRRKWR